MGRATSLDILQRSFSQFSSSFNVYQVYTVCSLQTTLLDMQNFDLSVLEQLFSSNQRNYVPHIYPYLNTEVLQVGKFWWIIITTYT